MTLGNPNTGFKCWSIHFNVVGSHFNDNELPPGYPEPNILLSGWSFKNDSAKIQCFKMASRVTLAQILAALTEGYRESAFLATVIFKLGNISDNLA